MSMSRHLVVGLGQSGLSASLFLFRRGIPFVVNDSRTNPPCLQKLLQAAGDVPVVTGRWDETLLNHTDRVVVSPGVSLAEPIVQKARAMGIPVVGDIQLFAEVVDRPVIGITGTNGKSTVTTLVAHLLNYAGIKALAGGNLGRAALDLLEDPLPEIYVLELSSYQLESTNDLLLKVASVLNVSPDHLDRYDSVTQYAAAKARIFKNAQCCVINADDALVRTMAIGTGEAIHFSETSSLGDFYLEQQGEHTRFMKKNQVLASSEGLQLKGQHNYLNVLAALAIVDPFQVSPEQLQNALRAFKGLAHRTQEILQINHVTYVNDSKGTNVGATVAAIKGSPAPLVLIAGGDGKGQDFSELAAVAQDRVRHAVVLGRDAEQIAHVLNKVCPVSYASTMPEAVQIASQYAIAGDWVLLSPACASLDMFSSYVERGEVFTQAVQGLVT